MVALLETKLYVPRRRSNVIPRQRLIARLDRAAKSRLTLVSAPAGFGKTTLLADWAADVTPDVVSFAWVSLDEHDNQPSVFWSYVLAALQRACPEVGSGLHEQLQSGEPPAIEALLTGLLNEVASSTRDIVLVLDDYHVIDAATVNEGVGFLVDHLPPSMHLVITSRSDPPLALARLRARGELAEIRAADLRFTREEAAAFLNQAMGLDLRAEDVAALEARTEGWIAGLQLAGLSMQGREDVAGFIADFAGNNRYVVDYLVEEVLSRQPDEIRRFLLQTSILERLSGPLCDAVTGGEGGKQTLEQLERGNLFVVPLDEKREWYRYHHLFADVLQAHLLDEGPAQGQVLHARASVWFERNSDLPAAIRHALSAEDFEHAAAMIEVAAPGILRSRQEDRLRAWLAALPDELIRQRPVLGVGYVGMLMQNGEISEVGDRLSDAEESLVQARRAGPDEERESGRPVYVDEAQFRGLPGMIALYRAGYSQITGNLPDTVKYARQALERMAEDEPLRGGEMALLGLALWSSGELEEAYKTYAEGIARVHKGGYVNDSSAIMLADMRVAQGRLNDALNIYQQAITAADELGQAAPRGIADMHVGISEIYVERIDLTAAAEHLAASRELGEPAGLPENRYRWYVAMAGLQRSQNDLAGALESLQQAERLYAAGFSPDLRPIGALRARVWIAQGRLDDALGWVRDRGLTLSDELSYLHEFEHVTLVRLLLAQAAASPADNVTDGATGLLARLLLEAEASSRGGSVIELLVLQALAFAAKGNVASALDPLRRALSLAEPEGYARVFIDEGARMKSLLVEVAKRPGGGYARRLAAGMEDQPLVATKHEDHEALSERELEVVRLLGSDLSGPEIARELVVSLNTMRTHTKSIYSKLGVNSRRTAVRRAEELGLI